MGGTFKPEQKLMKTCFSGVVACRSQGTVRFPGRQRGGYSEQREWSVWLEAGGQTAERLLCSLCPRRAGESDCSDGEEDFYYTEIKLNTDAVAEVAPVSPSQSLASPPAFPIPDSSRTETPCAKTDAKLGTPLSRSAPTTLYLVHTDHAYQVRAKDLA